MYCKGIHSHTYGFVRGGGGKEGRRGLGEGGHYFLLTKFFQNTVYVQNILFGGIR